MAWRPFVRRADGVVVARLRAEEAALLRSLAGELRTVLGDPAPTDPVVERLFPRAYDDPTEDRAETEWQALVGPDLLRGRLDALELLTADLDAAGSAGDDVECALEDEAVQRWLSVLNDARLALGVRLGVRDDEELDVPADDPRADALTVYTWLSRLEAELVDVLLEALPEEGEGPADAGG